MGQFEEQERKRRVEEAYKIAEFEESKEDYARRCIEATINKIVEENKYYPNLEEGEDVEVVDVDGEGFLEDRMEMANAIEDAKPEEKKVKLAHIVNGGGGEGIFKDLVEVPNCLIMYAKPIKMYSWQPKEDITAYEMSKAMLYLIHGGLTQEIIENPDNLNWSRHFKAAP